MKLAFIGTGNIIKDALFATEPIKELEKTAIFARPHSLEKAEAFAEQYHIKEVYTDYGELLEKTEADTVYIGLINSAHYPYAKEALLCGKNVILEKPFTGFYKEAIELKELAEEKQLLIFEAITVLHGPLFAEMKKNIKKMGTLRMSLCNYSQYSSRYDKYLAGDITPTFQTESYGGAMYDINVYNIHYCVGLFGKPNAVQYFPNLGPNGIDTSGTLVMSYDGFSCVCTGAKDSDSACYVSIQGEKGNMRLDGKPNAATKLITTYVDESTKEKVRDSSGAMVRATIVEEFTAEIQCHRMTEEFRDFTRMIDEKDFESAKEYMEETVIVLGVLEEARIKAGIEF